MYPGRRATAFVLSAFLFASFAIGFASFAYAKDVIINEGGTTDGSGGTSEANKMCPAPGSTGIYSESLPHNTTVQVNGKPLFNLYGKPCKDTEQSVGGLTAVGICTAEDKCKAEKYIGLDGKEHSIEDIEKQIDQQTGAGQTGDSTTDQPKTGEQITQEIKDENINDVFKDGTTPIENAPTQSAPTPGTSGSEFEDWLNRQYGIGGDNTLPDGLGFTSGEPVFSQAFQDYLNPSSFDAIEGTIGNGLTGGFDGGLDFSSDFNFDTAGAMPESTGFGAPPSSFDEGGFGDFADAAPIGRPTSFDQGGFGDFGSDFSGFETSVADPWSAASFAPSNPSLPTLPDEFGSAPADFPTYEFDSSAWDSMPAPVAADWAGANDPVAFSDYINTGGYKIAESGVVTNPSAELAALGNAPQGPANINEITTPTDLATVRSPVPVALQPGETTVDLPASLSGRWVNGPEAVQSNFGTLSYGDISWINGNRTDIGSEYAISNQEGGFVNFGPTPEQLAEQEAGRVEVPQEEAPVVPASESVAVAEAQSPCSWSGFSLSGCAKAAWESIPDFVSSADAKPFHNLYTKDSLLHAADAICADQGCDATFYAQSLGGVCGAESTCDASTGGGAYTGLGQLSVEERINATENLLKLSESPNLSEAQRDEVSSVVNRINDQLAAGKDPNRDPELGAWLLAGRQVSLGQMGSDVKPLEQVSAVTNDPREAAHLYELGQIAPAIYVKDENGLSNVLDPSKGISSGVASAFRSNGIDVRTGDTIPEVLAAAQERGHLQANITGGLAFGSPVPLPVARPGTGDTALAFNGETDISASPAQTAISNALENGATPIPAPAWDPYSSAGGLSGGTATQNDLFGEPSASAAPLRDGSASAGSFQGGELDNLSIEYPSGDTLRPDVSADAESQRLIDSGALDAGYIPNEQETQAIYDANDRRLVDLAYQSGLDTQQENERADLAAQQADLMERNAQAQAEFDEHQQLMADQERAFQDRLARAELETRQFNNPEIPSPSFYDISGEDLTAQIQSEVDADVAANVPIPDTTVPSGEDITAQVQNDIENSIPTPDTSYTPAPLTKEEAWASLLKTSGSATAPETYDGFYDATGIPKAPEPVSADKLADVVNAAKTVQGDGTTIQYDGGTPLTKEQSENAAAELNRTQRDTAFVSDTYSPINTAADKTQLTEEQVQAARNDQELKLSAAAQQVSNRAQELQRIRELPNDYSETNPATGYVTSKAELLEQAQQQLDDAQEVQNKLANNIFDIATGKMSPELREAIAGEGYVGAALRKAAESIRDFANPIASLPKNQQDSGPFSSALQTVLGYTNPGPLLGDIAAAPIESTRRVAADFGLINLTTGENLDDYTFPRSTLQKAGDVGMLYLSVGAPYVGKVLEPLASVTGIGSAVEKTAANAAAGIELGAPVGLELSAPVFQGVRGANGIYYLDADLAAQAGVRTNTAFNAAPEINGARTANQNTSVVQFGDDTARSGALPQPPSPSVAIRDFLRPRSTAVQNVINIDQIAVTRTSRQIMDDITADFNAGAVRTINDSVPVVPAQRPGIEITNDIANASRGVDDIPLPNIGTQSGDDLTRLIRQESDVVPARPVETTPPRVVESPPVRPVLDETPVAQINKAVDFDSVTVVRNGEEMTEQFAVPRSNTAPARTTAGEAPVSGSGDVAAAPSAPSEFTNLPPGRLVKTETSDGLEYVQYVPQTPPAKPLTPTVTKVADVAPTVETAPAAAPNPSFTSRMSDAWSSVKQYTNDFFAEDFGLNESTFVDRTPPAFEATPRPIETPSVNAAPSVQTGQSAAPVVRPSSPQITLPPAANIEAPLNVAPSVGAESPIALPTPRITPSLDESLAEIERLAARPNPSEVELPSVNTGASDIGSAPEISASPETRPVPSTADDRSSLEKLRDFISGGDSTETFTQPSLADNVAQLGDNAVAPPAAEVTPSTAIPGYEYPPIPSDLRPTIRVVDEPLSDGVEVAIKNPFNNAKLVTTDIDALQSAYDGTNDVVRVVVSKEDAQALEAMKDGAGVPPEITVYPVRNPPLANSVELGDAAPINAIAPNSLISRTWNKVKSIFGGGDVDVAEIVPKAEPAFNPDNPAAGSVAQTERTAVETFNPDNPTAGPIAQTERTAAETSTERPQIAANPDNPAAGGEINPLPPANSSSPSNAVSGNTASKPTGGQTVTNAAKGTLGAVWKTTKFICRPTATTKVACTVVGGGGLLAAGFHMWPYSGTNMSSGNSGSTQPSNGSGAQAGNGANNTGAGSAAPNGSNTPPSQTPKSPGPGANPSAKPQPHQQPQPHYTGPWYRTPYDRLSNPFGFDAGFGGTGMLGGVLGQAVGQLFNGQAGQSSPQSVQQPTPTPSTPSTPSKPQSAVILIANPSDIAAGEATTLSWSAAGPATCTVKDPSGATVAEGSPNPDTKAPVRLTLATTTTFTVSCSGGAGSADDKATVTVH